MPGPIRLQTVTGDAILPLLPDLARLRMSVFRTWPYLYDGEEAYERDYLQRYARSPRAAIIVARDGAVPVGASTCIPMQDEDAAISAPFTARGWDLARLFYFGESVLLPAYRGQGIGVAFFAAREAQAHASPGCDHACFCSVQRPPDHPARPPDAVPLDDFWRRRGYAPVDGLTCAMRWKEVGMAAEVDHTLAFWIKALRRPAVP